MLVVLAAVVPAVFMVVTVMFVIVIPVVITRTCDHAAR